MSFEGGCFCGAVRYIAGNSPGVVTHCHCIHCRRISGAAFVTWAEFPYAEFSFINGSPAFFSSREGVTRSFCASCGTPLTYRNAGTQDRIDVTACSLDHPEAVTPQDHVHHRRALPWIHLSDRLPTYRMGRNDP